MRLKALTFIFALNIVILFLSNSHPDNYQTLFDLKDTPDNVRKINDSNYALTSGKQDKIFDVWTTTPTVNDLADGRIVIASDRIIFKSNGVIYYVQGR